MKETNFSSKYVTCEKSIETEVIFIKLGMNKETNVNFLTNMICVCHIPYHGTLIGMTDSSNMLGTIERGVIKLTRLSSHHEQ